MEKENERPVIRLIKTWRRDFDNSNFEPAWVIEQSVGNKDHDNWMVINYENKAMIFNKRRDAIKAYELLIADSPEEEVICRSDEIVEAKEETDE